MTGRKVLLCVGRCRRRLPREEFRETPWHGRAAACVRCETFPGYAGRSFWQIEQDERIHWELRQVREKLRMYQRYAARLKAERYDGWLPRIVLGMGQDPDSVRLDAFAGPLRVMPLEPPMSVTRLSPGALSKAHTDIEEERWQTPTT
ncbi:hypothetical protein [Streptomyces sp. NPDC056061]|uniref:hypothetical protein n=1 Tax=Streptomyces sp. NPDC056061 TaxID=3345700 RepID=UPI0035D6DDF1